LERKAEILIQDRTQLKQKYLTELKRLEEAHERCKVSEEEVKVANKFVETAQLEVLAAEIAKRDASRSVHNRMTCPD
jgi:hypothetical protein